jgi:hypothetical protein
MNAEPTVSEVGEIVQATEATEVTPPKILTLLPHAPAPEIVDTPEEAENRVKLTTELSPFLELAKASKAHWCGMGHEIMPPTIVGLDADNKPIVKVLYIPDPRGGSPRDKALSVAERVMRGMGADRVVVMMEMYSQRVQKESLGNVFAGSMQMAHEIGFAPGESVSECMKLFSVGKNTPPVQLTAPFEWDREKKGDGLAWFPADDYIQSPAVGDTLEGEIWTVLNQVAAAPPFSDDPNMLAGLKASGVTMEDGEEYLKQKVARSTIAVLAIDMNCGLVFYDDRFGTDIQEMLNEMVKRREQDRDPAHILKKFEEDLAGPYSRYGFAKPPAARPDRAPRPPRPDARTRAELRRKSKKSK